MVLYPTIYVKWNVVAHGVKNMANAMTIAQEALRHSSSNHTSPTHH